MSTRPLLPALVLATLLALGHLLLTPPFWPVDETAHVAYAHELVTTWQVPTVDTPIPDDLDQPGLAQRLAWERDQGRVGRQDIWTANHPPLPYLVQGLALLAGDAIAGPPGGLALARLTSVAWLVVGVWATGQLGWLLAGGGTGRPRRRRRHRELLDPTRVGVLAALVVAATPTLTHLAGLVFNDAAAFALITLCLWAGARVALWGPGRRDLLLLGLLAAAGTATRVSVLPAVAAMVVLATYGWWRTPPPERPRPQPWGMVALVLAMAPGVTFWVSNVVRYGDPTASAHLLVKFHRDVNSSLGALLTDRFTWLRLWNRMLGDLTTGHWATGLRADATEALLLIALAGALAGVLLALPRRGSRGGLREDWDRRVRRGRDLVARPTWRGIAEAARRRPLAVAWLVCAATAGSLVLSALTFHAIGGSLHGRYAAGGMAVVATALVLLLERLPRLGTVHLGRLAATAAPALVAAVNASLMQALWADQSDTWTRPGIRLSLPLLAGPETPAIALGLAVLAAAALMLGLRGWPRSTGSRFPVPSRARTLAPGRVATTRAAAVVAAPGEDQAGSESSPSAAV